MKYIKEKDILLSDFDGVLFDSQSKFKEVMKEETDFNLWNEYLNSINWSIFYKNCNLVKDSYETLSELEKLKILKGFITKIHSIYEGEEKLKILRDMGFKVPVYYVLPFQRKDEIYVPNNNTILLDDSVNNLIEWEKSGGKVLLYDPNSNIKSSNTIKNLKDLL